MIEDGPTPSIDLQGMVLFERTAQLPAHDAAVQRYKSAGSMVEQTILAYDAQSQFGRYLGALYAL